MTIIPARWRRALLLYAWRLLECWRVRLVRCQEWLEQRFGGWGEEIGFASDSGRWDEDHTGAVPAHWAEVVRRGAPWLLRRPVPPGGTGSLRQPAPHASAVRTDVGTALSGAGSVAASIYEDDAVVPTPEARGESRPLLVDAGSSTPRRRFDVSPHVFAAAPLLDVAASCSDDGIAGSARQPSVTPAYRDGVTPGSSLAAAFDETGSSGVATALHEQGHVPVAEHEAGNEIVLSFPADDDAVTTAMYDTRNEQGLPAARLTLGSHSARIGVSQQRSADVFISTTPRTAVPSWPALPGEEGRDGDGWPDLPGTTGTPAASDDLDAWGVSQEQRWSA